MESVGVGLLGLGTVGAAVARRLINEWELLGERAGATPVLRCVAVRDLSRSRDLELKNVRLLADAAAVVDDPGVAIVMEAIGGTEPATALIESALQAGKTVVTANKAVIAASGPRLAALAGEHGAGLYFEAAVGAGLPIVGLLGGSLLGDRIASLDCVINGTTNVILTKMRSAGTTFDSALADAQRRGFAEADPTLDVDGWDAAQKLVILAWLAMGVHVPTDAVDRLGIRGVGGEDVSALSELGYRVRLLAHAERSPGGAVHLRARPTAVGPGHLLGDVDDADNAVIISSDLAARVMLRGLGAGGASTASAMVSDLVSAVRERDTHRSRVPSRRRTASMLGDEEVEVAGYVRLRLSADADARALVLQTLEDRGLAVDAAVDLEPDQLMVLTGVAPRAVHDGALETLDTLSAVAQIECTLDRVEVQAAR
ncbi:MAG TPA: homoserine dehydrogenase [Candidatus Dormibacteraeota bacterium]|jgi:homoserine dehydrogenase